MYIFKYLDIIRGLIDKNLKQVEKMAEKEAKLGIIEKQETESLVYCTFRNIGLKSIHSTGLDV